MVKGHFNSVPLVQVGTQLDDTAFGSTAAEVTEVEGVGSGVVWESGDVGADAGADGTDDAAPSAFCEFEEAELASGLDPATKLMVLSYFSRSLERYRYEPWGNDGGVEMLRVSLTEVSMICYKARVTQTASTAGSEICRLQLYNSSAGYEALTASSPRRKW